MAQEMPRGVRSDQRNTGSGPESPPPKRAGQARHSIEGLRHGPTLARCCVNQGQPTGAAPRSPGERPRGRIVGPHEAEAAFAASIAA